MTAGKLSALLALSAAGTPGEWSTDCYTVHAPTCKTLPGETVEWPVIAETLPDRDHQGIPRVPTPVYSEVRANAALIAAAVNFVRDDLPGLVRVLEAARTVELELHLAGGPLVGQQELTDALAALDVTR